MCVIYQKYTNNFRGVLTKKLFSSFFGAILIAISEINYIKHYNDRNYESTNTRIWAQTEAYERHAGRNTSGLDRHAGHNSRFWSWVKTKILVETQVVRMSSRS
jgi:hypothetical protein